jgi:hypothetical protein
MQIRPPLHEVVSGREAEKAPGKRQINLKPFIAAGYLMLLGLMVIVNAKQVSKLKSFKEGLSPIPCNALVLSSFNLQYKALFLRPDIRLIPSCELGFANWYILEEYTAFFNDGMIVPIAKKTRARFFLDGRNMYIRPTEGDYVNKQIETEQYVLWSISSGGKAGTF